MKVFVRFFICLSFLLTLACGDNTNEKSKSNDYSNVLLFTPDSVSVDSTINGYLKYRIDLQPLSKEKLLKKYTFLYLGNSKGKINSFEALTKIEHDTFVSIENNVIPIYDLKPQSSGDIYVQGFLVHQFFYGGVNDSIRIITQEIKIEKEVHVY